MFDLDAVALLVAAGSCRVFRLAAPRALYSRFPRTARLPARAARNAGVRSTTTGTVRARRCSGWRSVTRSGCPSRVCRALLHVGATAARHASATACCASCGGPVTYPTTRSSPSQSPAVSTPEASIFQSASPTSSGSGRATASLRGGPRAGRHGDCYVDDVTAPPSARETAQPSASHRSPSRIAAIWMNRSCSRTWP